MGYPAFRAVAAFNGRLDVELEPRRFGHHIGCPGGIPDELDLDLGDPLDFGDPRFDLAGQTTGAWAGGGVSAGWVV